MNRIPLDSLVPPPTALHKETECLCSGAVGLLEEHSFLRRARSSPDGPSSTQETPLLSSRSLRLFQQAHCFVTPERNDNGSQSGTLSARLSGSRHGDEGVVCPLENSRTVHPNVCEKSLNAEVGSKRETAPSLEGAQGSTAEYTMKRGSVNVTVRVRPTKGKNTKASCFRLHEKDSMIEYVPLSRDPHVSTKVHGFPFGGTLTSLPSNGSRPQESEERSSFFTFDTVLGDSVTQSEVMDRVGRPILQHVLEGFNGTILCYGQSGSGKTHTMLGPAGGLPERVLDSDEAGILPRTLQELFVRLNGEAADPGNAEPTPMEWRRSRVGEDDVPSVGTSGCEVSQILDTREYAVEVSAMEIYKETMNDLLEQFTWKAKASRKASDGGGRAQAGGRKVTIVERDANQCQAPSNPSFRHAKSSKPSAALRIRDTAEVGAVVEGLSWHPVRDADEALRVLKWALRQRQVGSTAINKRSGRSHLFFYVALRQRGAQKPVNVSKLGGQPASLSHAVITETRSLATFVDLAGSERVADTQAKGKRLQEARHINLSLTLLGNVIRKLTASSKGGDTAHIPYRDSKLTRLLQESIGGNAVTALLCTISPDVNDTTETLSTLHFAKCAKRVQNRPVAGRMETKAELVAKLKRLTLRNEWLEGQLSTMSSRLGSLHGTPCALGRPSRSTDDAFTVALCSSALSELRREKDNNDILMRGLQDSLYSSPAISPSHITPRMRSWCGKAVSEDRSSGGPAGEPIRCARVRRAHKVTVFTSLSFAFWALAARFLCLLVPSVKCAPAPVEDVFIPVSDCPACMSTSPSHSRPSLPHDGETAT